MKIGLSFFLCLFVLRVVGQPIPPAATQAEVDAGVNRYKYVSPFTLNQWPGGGGSTGQVTTAQLNTASNVLQVASSNNVRVAAGTGGITVVTSSSSGIMLYTVSDDDAGGAPGGSTAAVQFNQSGAFAGTNRFVYDRTNDILTIEDLQIDDTAISTLKSSLSFSALGDGVRINSVTPGFHPITAFAMDSGDIVAPWFASWEAHSHVRNALYIYAEDFLSNPRPHSIFTHPATTIVTNKYILSVTNPAVGQVLGFNAVSFSGGIASIILSNVNASLFAVRTNGVIVSSAPTELNFVTGSGVLLPTTNASGVIGHGTTLDWVQTASTTNVVGVSNWVNTVSNLVQTKQQGNAVLTNLVGTVANNVTNVTSLSTSNALSKPLTNSYGVGKLSLYGLQAGPDIILTQNESNIVISVDVPNLNFIAASSGGIGSNTIFRSAIYLGDSLGQGSQIYSYDIPSSQYRLVFSSGSSSIEWGTNDHNHFVRGVQWSPTFDNVTDLGLSSRRWRNGWINNLTSTTNITVNGIPGLPSGMLTIGATNVNRALKLTVPPDLASTNELVFDLGVPSVGQTFTVHAVSGQRATITNSTPSAGGVGDYITNNQATSKTFTNSGVYMPVAFNTTTNIDWAVADVQTNKISIGTTAVACLFSNVTANRQITVCFVNVTNDATLSFPATVIWYGEPAATAVSNSTTFISFNTHDGKTNGMLIAGGRRTGDYTVYAVGTAYTTTTTPAQANFGTTDPVLTLTAAGTYALHANVGAFYNAATYASSQTLTVKLRKTSGTAADVSNATRTLKLPVLTTYTGGDTVSIPVVIYTAAAGDVIEIYASVSATPSAGTVEIDSAEIVAIRLP